MRGFKYHKHLCPKIWDSENRMDQLAVQSLCMMAWDFVRYLQFLGVPIKQSDVLDIVVHGSATNYYWDSKSDIDLAIVADLSNVEKWVNIIIFYGALSFPTFWFFTFCRGPF